MRISVIGCGYLGAVHAAAMTELGHDVIGIDVDARRVDALAAGRAPFHEPGFADLLSRSLASGRLRFSTDVDTARDAAVHFVCVGTPQRDDGLAADIRYVDAAVDALLPVLDPGNVVVGKSTVPVGTAIRLAETIAAKVPDAALVWNPEFLREGHAVNDTLHPDRVVYGVADGPAGAAARRVLDGVYARILAAGTPQVVTDFATAEMVKTAANAFLATKISFINAMAELCDATGADVTRLAEALGHDDRIGPKFLGAGLGFGGGCLPKDIRAFLARADELGAQQAVGILREVDAVNARQRNRTVELARELCGGQLAGRRIAVLGAAFKPDSDDIRDSPALDVALRLHERGALVRLTDVAALDNCRRAHPQLHLVPSPQEAANAADAVLVLTDWPQYTSLDPARLGERVAHKRVLDGRNALDRDRWEAAGWTFRSLGRPARAAA